MTSVLQPTLDLDNRSGGVPPPVRSLRAQRELPPPLEGGADVPSRSGTRGRGTSGSLISRSRAVLCLLLSAVCLLSTAGEAPKPESQEIHAEKGPVKMSVILSPKNPRLSETLDMTLRLETEEGVELYPPPFGEAIGEFVIRDYSEKKPASVPGKLIREFYYQLEPAHAGKHLIHSIAAEFTDKRPASADKETKVLIESDPIEVDVISDLGNETPNLSNLAPMRPPFPAPSTLAFWLMIAGGALWLVVMVFVIQRLRAKKSLFVPAPVKRSPEEIARAELEFLLKENLHGKGQFKEFYVRLTGIVRSYIEATTGLRAPEQTTEEFLRDMRAKNVFPTERSLQLADFLEAADLVKYAGQQPGERQIQDSISRAQEFIGLPSAFAAMPEKELAKV